MEQRGRGVIINMAASEKLHHAGERRRVHHQQNRPARLDPKPRDRLRAKIRCVAICPGTVDTPMLHWAVQQSPDPQAVLKECDEMHPMKRIAKPEEIAAMVLFLASEHAGFITGQYVHIDGGLGISVGGSKRE